MLTREHGTCTTTSRPVSWSSGASEQLALATRCFTFQHMHGNMYNRDVTIEIQRSEVSTRCDVEYSRTTIMRLKKKDRMERINQISAQHYIQHQLYIVSMTMTLVVTRVT